MVVIRAKSLAEATDIMKTDTVPSLTNQGRILNFRAPLLCIGLRLNYSQGTFEMI